MFRLVAILFPFVTIAVIEMGLRATGVDPATPLFVHHPSATILPWQVNSAAEQPYFTRHDLAGPEGRRFELPAPENTFRIVVLGASTVQGFPYDPALAFPRQLEFLLNNQLENAGDVRRVEVLNLGITAINSFSLVDMAQRCLQCEPDLVVFYAGHNEFYGPGGAASTARLLPPSLYPIGLAARRTAIFKAWNEKENSASNASPDSPIDSLPETLQIAYEGDLYRSAVQHYESNLRQIVGICETAGVPLVLSTVISNLKDHSPTSYLLPEDADSVDPDWRTLFDQGRAAASAGEYEVAIEKLKAAADLYDGSSLLYYRMGKCLLNLGRVSEAVQAYSKARDLDGSRFRAPSCFVEIVRSVAGESENTLLVDIETQLRQSDSPLPGQKLFLEHVHPNLEGHRFIASCLGQAVFQRHFDEMADWRMPTVQEWEQALGILPVDRLAGLSLTFDVLNSDTMSQSFDHQRHLAALADLIRDEYQRLPEGYRGYFPELSTSQMSSGLLRNLLQKVPVADLDLRREILQAAITRSPWLAEFRSKILDVLVEPDDSEMRSIHERAMRELRLDVVY